jgi:hypothetical protein
LQVSANPEDTGALHLKVLGEQTPQTPFPAQMNVQVWTFSHIFVALQT